MKGRPRRGSGAVALVLLLAVLTMAVLGSVAASGDEAAIGALRVETARAFYAAEGGCVVAIRTSSEGEALPAPGTVLALPYGTATFVALPATAQGGDLVVMGRSGLGQRRIKVTLVAP